MKHLFIINPAAGKYNHSIEFTKKIAAFCKPRGLDYETYISQCKGDCTARASLAAKTGEDYRIYACGGDGTLNEVVCGVVGYKNVAVTHLPGGSGNDFIRMFGDYDAFSDLARLTSGVESELDLIRVGDLSYALNICSIGIDARIGTEVSRYKRLPGVSGPGAYNLSTIVNVIKGIHRPYEIEVDGKTFSSRQTLIAVCSGRYYGSGFNPVPDAEPDDGLLDVLLVKAVSRMTVATVIGRYKEGRYKEMPGMFTHYRVPSIRVSCGEESVVNVDGEAVYAKDVEFSVAPEKLRFFYPEGLTYKR